MRPGRGEQPDIIYRPDLQPRGQRVLFSGITLLAWIIWLYLFLPLISLAAWWFGIESFREQVLEPGRSGHLVTLSVYAVVVAVSALIIIGWSRYNLVRFRRADRRRPLPPVTTEMTRERFALEADMLRDAQRARILEIDLDGEGRLRSAKVRATIDSPLSAD
ncbi:MAG: poly-beta-1,6-N-acetyl-D-glucosamine biosynthesis protein PgaD [Xanthomonadales bacterium]|nr:poly-beta-1,6-N-acetyl-D-glucosamine biosynthesis protein PgaD [Xanthomonadales bacterium]